MKHSGGVRVKTTGSAVLVLSKARAGLFGILEVIREDHRGQWVKIGLIQ